VNIIIPIGGTGKRFLEDGYLMPKPLIKSLGKSIIFWNIGSLNLKAEDTVYIVYREEFKIFNFEEILSNQFRRIKFKFVTIKNDTRGASETVLYALQEMSKKDLEKNTIVIDSDNFYNDDILARCRTKKENVIFFKKDYDKNPIYSYILIDGSHKVINIKEKEKISDNACVGAYCFSSGEILKNTIKSVILEERKQKNEFYISSLYKFLIEEGIAIKAKEIEGFNCLGTPNQVKSFSSNLNTNFDKYRFCFDLDNTLVTYPEIEGDYSSVKPIPRAINFLNFLHSQGHTIIIHTARRMKTHSGNVGKVQSDVGKITFETLDKFKINYDEIYFGKPYAHFYIDDLALKPSDDLEKETGFYNIHPETRDHNKIEIFDKFIIKYSSNIEGEKYYYKNIPPEVDYLFPKMLESGKDFIKLSKVQGIPLSFLNGNSALNEKIINIVLESIEILHSNKPEKEINVYSNYYDKVVSRIESYDFSPYPNFHKTKDEILDFLKNYESEKRAKIGIIHGDPVFTNILIDEKDSIKMIDMRGRIGESLTIYGDIFYDYAKIYQSIIGYDHILTNKEPDLDYINTNKDIFSRYIINKFGEDRLKEILQISKSLILSLIPIHDNEKCMEYYNLIDKI
jgi:capsule biosynthesis phosphatase